MLYQMYVKSVSNFYTRKLCFLKYSFFYYKKLVHYPVCINIGVIDNKLMPVLLWLTQIEMGNRLKLYSLFQKQLFNSFVRKVRVKLYDKMQSGVIFYYTAFLFGETAFYG